MADDSPAPAALPDFTPVPRLKDRSNGWKPHVQRAFIEALAETGSVAAACRRVGRADHGVYQLRRHPDAQEFRAAWDAALDLGVRRIEDAAMDRALYGAEEHVFYHGELKTTRRRYNERLVMFILRNRAGDRYAVGGGAKGLSGLDKQQLARFKKQWREEWLREQRDSEPDVEEIRAEILSKVAALEAHDRTRWSQRERELNGELQVERARRKEREAAETRDRLRELQPWRFLPETGDDEPADEPPAPGADSVEAAAEAPTPPGEAPLDEARARLLGLVEERAARLGEDEGNG